MKILAKTAFLLFLACSLTALCSCSFFVYDNAKFEGGTPLDDDFLSKIKEIVDNGGETESPLGTYTEESIHKTESSASYTETVESEQTSKDEQTSKVEGTTENEVVYWTNSGQVWHTNNNCSHLRNSKNIMSGTIGDAINNGKTRVCSYCGGNTEP